MDVRIAADDDYDRMGSRLFCHCRTFAVSGITLAPSEGVPETYSEQFPFCVETYLNFIYQYSAGKLRDVSPYTIEEFFMEYLLRKVMAETARVHAVAARTASLLPLFVRKGLYRRSGANDGKVACHEPDFIALVQQRS